MRTNKRTPKEWQNTITMLQKSWPREIEGMEEKIMMKLKASYDNLTEDIIPKCFLLCCLWPEDHSIPKIDLIQMLKIQNCGTLEVVSMKSDGEGSTRSSQKWNLSRLEHMELRNLPAFKEIIWRGVMPAKNAASLTVVNIYGCKKLSDISWAMRLRSLEELTVCSCHDLEQVVHDNHKGIREVAAF
ncbi:putative disease resistance protein [Platanthera guangdongensis]|uniref:Disease resistance protein n=1 Tax=Platanthera guangdongensis TaxID=2320717 RepID=A0ABR2LI53_9ASPA